MTAFPGGFDPHRAVLLAGQLTAHVRHGGDFRIRSRGVVVKKDQSLDAGPEREIKRGPIIRMAPASPLLDLSGCVLGIMDKDIRILAERRIFLGSAPGSCIRSQFIIGNEDQAPFSLAKTKTEASLGMLQRNAVYKRTVDLEGTPAEAIEVTDLGLKIVKPNREKPVPHLIIKGEPQALHTGVKTVDQDPARRFVNRGKKREAEDMIPMNMCDQKVNINWSLRSSQLLAQSPDTATRINDHFAATLEIDFQTRGIPSIQGRIFPRYCDRNPHLALPG